VFRERHAWSEGVSPFNTHLYARRQTPRGLALIARGASIEVDRDGGVRASPIAGRAERDALLRALGYSDSLTSRVPEDDAG
jgi:hypothetical protein